MFNNKQIRKFAAFALLASLVIGCSSKDEDELAQTEKVLYEAAASQLESGNYVSAIKNLQMLEARFPFGPYAEQAQLELVYAYYKNFDNDAAIAAAERFIRLHPQHPNVDYAYYMRGLANYSAGKGLFDRFSPTDQTQRDPGSARQSFNDFSALVTRYPNSEYAADARAEIAGCLRTGCRLLSVGKTFTALINGQSRSDRPGPTIGLVFSEQETWRKGAIESPCDAGVFRQRRRNHRLYRVARRLGGLATGREGFSDSGCPGRTKRSKKND